MLERGVAVAWVRVEEGAGDKDLAVGMAGIALGTLRCST
jgi:hypothetical protein